MNELDLIKLNIYEAYEAGEITEAEKEYLLEQACDSYNELSYNQDKIINEAALDILLKNDSYIMEDATTEALQVYFSDQKKDIQRLIKEGRAAIKAGDYDKAITLFSECKKELTSLQDKLHSINEDAFENFVGQLVRSIIDSLTGGLVAIIQYVDGLLTTRRFRGGAAAVTGAGAGVDYTEPFSRRVFQNYTKRQCESAVAFMIDSVNKTLVSLNKLKTAEKSVNPAD